MKKLIISIYYNLIQFITSILPNNSKSNYIRGFLLSPCFKRSGKKTQIGRNVIINCIWNIEIEDYVYISHFCYINGVGGLILGKGVIVSPMCIISTSNHVFDDDGVTNKAVKKPIEIGEGSYIAGNCVINAGVKIGKKAKVGGNSMVIHNVEDCQFVSGVPAKEVKKNGSN